MAGKTFFVAGITGHVGGAAAALLLEEGHAVRTLARDPRKAAAWAAKGVDVRNGAFEDASAVAGAMEGVDGAFVMVPPTMAPEPGFPESKAVIASLREALGKARPGLLAVLSSIGSEKTSGLGLITATHLLEQGLGDLEMPTAFVRAGGFYENFSYALQQAEAMGVFDTFLTPADRAVPMIASVDIGKLIGRLLADGWAGKKIVELGSRVSPDEIAGALTEVLGKPVAARVIPREHWVAALEGMGFPKGKTGAFEEMEDHFNSGWIDFGVAEAEAVAATVTPVEFFAGLKAK